MHLPECHFKVAELKMHLRSLVPGAVSRRGGVGGCAGGRGGWREEGAGGSNGGGGGKACVSSLERAALIHGECLKWGSSRRASLGGGIGGHGEPAAAGQPRSDSVCAAQAARPRGGSVSVSFLTDTASALSILKVPPGTHQEDDS